MILINAKDLKDQLEWLPDPEYSDVIATIDETPAVEAIPVDWIMTWIHTVYAHQVFYEYESDHMKDEVAQMITDYLIKQLTPEQMVSAWSQFKDGHGWPLEERK